MFKLRLILCFLTLSCTLHAQRAATRLVSPEVLPDKSVIIRLKAPEPKPTMFKYIGVMSMGLFSGFGNNSAGYDKDKHVHQLKALIAAKPNLYWIGMGKSDFLFDSAIKLRGLYDEVGLKYTYWETDGNHVWNEWRLYLTELVPVFFK